MDAVWGWYLEWSRIARAVIKDRNLLRILGFLRKQSTGATKVTNEADTDSDIDEEEVDTFESANTEEAPVAAQA